MVRARPLSHLVRTTPPRRAWGIAVAAFMIAAETLLVYPLRAITTTAGAALIYLLGVLLVSTLWGLWLGVATAVGSALAYVFFHVSPIGQFTASDSRDWVQLAVFLVVAVLISALADLSRLRAVEAQESDLTAEMARLLLNVDDVAAALPAVAPRIARALDLPATAVEVETFAPGCAVPAGTGSGHSARGDPRHLTFPLRADGTVLGVVRVPAGASDRQVQRLRQRVLPSLTALLRAACERAAMLNSLEVRGEAFERLARQQAALRGVATLVARGVSPAEVFDAVTAAVGRLLDNQHATLLRYEPGQTFSIVSTTRPDVHAVIDGSRPIEDGTIAGLVWRTGRAARIDKFADAVGPVAALRRELGIHAAVGVPIMVEGRLWGAAVITSVRPEPVPPDAEKRAKDFTDLVATAIVNADHRAQIIASRARIAAAADEERQRIERDLDIGGLQQLIAIGIKLHAAGEACAVPEPVRAQLAQVARDLNAVVEHLREFARGIHPAILTTRGLKPALKTLARRSAVPVDLHIGADLRLPPRVEVAAYHLVSEALNNAAKHAHASVVHVDVDLGHEALQLAIRDDGVGGADPDDGTGLTGLRDRVDALGGRLTVASPSGAGTLLLATIPIAADHGSDDPSKRADRGPPGSHAARHQHG